jgi:rhomboid protease GluP
MGSFRPEPAPEILPPEPGYTPPPIHGYGPAPEPVRKPRSSWSVAPATYVLLGINCAVFLLMLVRGVSPISPTPDQLLIFGADNAGAVLQYAEWQRIVTAMFVHVGIIHLATNMWCLWNLGMLAEPLLGSAGVVAAYILTGAAGNLLSVGVNWYMFHNQLAQGIGLYGPVGAGASGAVFGIAGVLIVLLKSPLLPVPAQELKKLRRSVIYFAAINLIIGIGTMVPASPVHIDNMAHLGGFGSGLLFAVPMVPRIGSSKEVFVLRRRIATAMLVVILVLFAFFLRSLAG